MTDYARLGPFELECPISSGGMGTVWLARHNGVHVAVKVISGAHAQNPLYLDGFEREVRAVAKMDHPGIIRVYDYGLVAENDASADESLTPGSPWLAMEFANRGSLAHAPAIDWPATQQILVDILDALAHSHARGIIHRDLKPGNVLLVETSEGIRFKLTDFGISHAAGQSASTREVFASAAGTPWYMAPEQVDVRWRDYGPWTDLYALGCLAYELISGVTPFVGESVVRVARQHLFDRPPPLEPRFEVPPAVVAWVDRLLVKEIPHRFRRAADAAWALAQISPLPPRRVSLSALTALARGKETIPFRNADSLAALDTELPGEAGPITTLTFLDADVERQATKVSTPLPFAGNMLTFSTPPFAHTWRRGSTVAHEPLRGAGLGLYRLRETPFVAREGARDQLWEMLRGVVSGRTMACAVLSGPAGMGKSRVARWIAQRSHELGATTNLYASHSPTGGAGHGLRAMLELYLGCAGLDLERTYLRIRRLILTRTMESPDVANYYAAALAHIIRGESGGERVPAVRFSRPDEKYRVIIRSLEALSRERPVLLCIDDVQWGFETLEFLRHLLAHSRREPFPAMILATLRHDQLLERPLENRGVNALLAEENVSVIEVGPLGPQSHERLIDQLLGLAPDLRAAVVKTTLGSPLFAAELLDDWVSSDDLTPTGDGFVLREGARLPSSLHELWSARLAHALAHLADPEAARAAVEIGATIGSSVTTREWLQACRSLGVEVDDGLLDALAAGRLIELVEDGWHFRHQMLRESVSRTARDAGRASSQHRVVSEALRSDGSPESHLRCGLLSLEVGDVESAVGPLLSAVEGFLPTGRLDEAGAVIDILSTAVERLPQDAIQRGQLMARRADLLFLKGRHVEVLAVVEAGLEEAVAREWTATLSTFHRLRGAVSGQRGQWEEALHDTTEALDLANRGRDIVSIANAHHNLGWLSIAQNRYDEAVSHFEAARDHFRMHNDPVGEAVSIAGLGEVARVSGNFAEARRLTDDAIRICRHHGHRQGLIANLGARGDIDAAAGEWQSARRFHAEALATAELTGLSTASPRLNLGRAMLRAADPRAAREMFASARAEFSLHENPLHVFVADMGIAAAAAALGATEEFDRILTHHENNAPEPDASLLDTADLLLHAAGQWLERGEPARANRLKRIARGLVPDDVGEKLDSRWRLVVAEYFSPEITRV